MKNTRIAKIITGLTGALFLLLAGCSSAANYADGDIQHRNLVEMIRLPYMMTFEKDRSNLTRDSIAQLDSFMRNSHVSYGDELSMDFPLQRDGGLSDENKKRLAYLSALLLKRGLTLSSEVTPYGMSPNKNQARLLISRYVVTPPRCGDWSQPSNNNYGNAPTAALGCANQANLGLMVANPRDLITGASNDVPDAENSARAIHAYKTKTPTTVTPQSTSKIK